MEKRFRFIVAALIAFFGTAVSSGSAVGQVGQASAGARESRIPVGGPTLFAREIGRGQPLIVLHGGPDFDGISATGAGLAGRWLPTALLRRWSSSASRTSYPLRSPRRSLRPFRVRRSSGSGTAVISLIWSVAPTSAERWTISFGEPAGRLAKNESPPMRHNSMK